VSERHDVHHDVDAAVAEQRVNRALAHCAALAAQALARHGDQARVDALITAGGELLYRHVGGRVQLLFGLRDDPEHDLLELATVPAVLVVRGGGQG
jgi:hypothetical protein